MIQMIVGENLFAVDAALADISNSYGLIANKYDGSDIDLNLLADIFSGGTLFSSKKLVVVYGLSNNKTIWGVLPEWLNRLSDDTNLILVEPKVDKRTKTFRSLQKASKMIDASLLTMRDERRLGSWLVEYAKDLGLSLSPVNIEQMISRSVVESDAYAPYIDQSMLAKAVEALSVYKVPDQQSIDAVLPPTKNENVFDIFVTAIEGKPGEAEKMLHSLEAHQSPHMIISLMSNQLFQLAALVYSDKPSEQVSKDMSLHPFMLSRLAPMASRQTVTQIENYVEIFASADERMKSSAGDPWDVLANLVAQLNHQ